MACSLYSPEPESRPGLSPAPSVHSTPDCRFRCRIVPPRGGERKTKARSARTQPSLRRQSELEGETVHFKEPSCVPANARLTKCAGQFRARRRPLRGRLLSREIRLHARAVRRDAGGQAAAVVARPGARLGDRRICDAARATHTRTRRESTSGKPSGRTQEIQRLIGRSLRAVTNLPLLGERQIMIDCDVIQADGGTRTAAITGAWLALRDCFEWMRSRSIIKDSRYAITSRPSPVAFLTASRCSISITPRIPRRRPTRISSSPRRRPSRNPGDGRSRGVFAARAAIAAWIGAKGRGRSRRLAEGHLA